MKKIVKWTCLIAGVATTAFFLGSCGAAKRSPDSAAPAEQAAATEADGETRSAAVSGKDKAPSVPGLHDFVVAHNGFAFDLYRTTYRDDLVLAPHAVAGQLQLIHAASGEQPRRQVERTLRMRNPEMNLRERHRVFLDAVAGRLGKPDTQRGFSIRSVNAAWISNKLSASSRFLQTATDHLATVQAVDFAAKDPLKVVEQHYDDATASKLTPYVTGQEKGPILLTSATVFDGPWDLPFEVALTKDRPFVSPQGERPLPMMHGRFRTSYLDGDGFQLVELPYAGREVSAWFLLPDEDQTGFSATLTAEHFGWMTDHVRQRELDVRIPRFELEQHADLAPALTTMGMPAPFAPDAALEEFTPSKQAHIGSVIHAARISVDEDGSDAVATTRSPVNVADQEVPVFEANRPFLVVIRHNGTGAVLALAHIANPAP